MDALWMLYDKGMPRDCNSHIVMAGLVTAIHAFAAKKTWMPGTRPGMTKKRCDLP
jgi:hypothetical protein